MVVDNNIKEWLVVGESIWNRVSVFPRHWDPLVVSLDNELFYTAMYTGETSKSYFDMDKTIILLLIEEESSIIQKWNKNSEVWEDYFDSGYSRSSAAISTVPLNSGIVDWCQENEIIEKPEIKPLGSERST